MGIFSSKNKAKQQPTIQVLEQLVEKVQRLEGSKRSNLDTQKRTIQSLIIYSILFYIVIGLIFYYCMPDYWAWKLAYTFYIFVFPIIVLLITRFIHWYFTRVIKDDEFELERLRDQKRQILDEVMENETYKKAREILLKFDPEKIRDSNPSTPEGANMTEAQISGTEIRRRNFATPNGSQQQDVAGNILAQQPQHLQHQTPIRPILKRDRTIMDRLTDYLLVDGPQNRYALICKECHSHNGMALNEEFEYLSFRCIYCSALNPSRKQKPTAPKLTDALATPTTYLKTSQPMMTSVRQSGDEAMPTSFLKTSQPMMTSVRQSGDEANIIGSIAKEDCKLVAPGPEDNLQEGKIIFRGP